MRKFTILVMTVIIAITAFGLCSCGNDNSSVVPSKFKGKWELCGMAPQDSDMSADNVITGKELTDTYGIDLNELSKNTIEFDKHGGMKPYTDGSIDGYSTDMVTRVSDDEVCYSIDILELDGKDLHGEEPIKMDVHAKLVDDYLFVWEEYTNTDEFDESDTYEVYQKVK